MKKHVAILIFLVTLLLSGLENASAMSCGDSQVKGRVANMFSAVLLNDVGGFKTDIEKGLKISVINPVVKTRDAGTGNVACNAEVRYRFSKERLASLAVDAKGLWEQIWVVFFASINLASYRSHGGFVLDRLDKPTISGDRKGWLLLFNALFETDFEKYDELNIARSKDLQLRIKITEAIWFERRQDPSDVRERQAIIDAISELIGKLENSKQNEIAVSVNYSIYKIDGNRGQYKVVLDSHGSEVEAIRDLEIFWQVYEEWRGVISK